MCETSHERFLRLSKSRKELVKKELAKIANFSDKYRYEYDAEEIKTLMNNIRTYLDEIEEKLMERFNDTGRTVKDVETGKPIVVKEESKQLTPRELQRKFNAIDASKPIVVKREIKQLSQEKLKSKYRACLTEFGYSESTVNDWKSNSFYLWNNGSNEKFWEAIENDENHAKEIMQECLDNMPNNTFDNNLDYYISRLENIKRFIIIFNSQASTHENIGTNKYKKLRKEFKAYLKDVEGLADTTLNTYATGVFTGIYNALNVETLCEYERDRCEELLSRIENDDYNSCYKRSDLASHTKAFVRFMDSRN